MLDLDALLAPLSAASPCGQDMLFSADFDAIQRAREHDDPSLEQGEWVIDLKEANWPFVTAECSRLLRESTKDLRLAVWLTDAMAAERGFAGLADGYRLLSGLCERYWDELHPMADNGDNDMRIGNVAWLVARSVYLLERTPIVNDGDQHHSTLTWQTAVALQHQIRRSPEQADELSRGKVSVEQFDAVRRSTPGSFLLEAHAQLLDCRDAVQIFERLFDQRTAAQGPSFAPVREAIGASLHAVERIMKDAGVTTSTAAPAGDAAAMPLAQDKRVEPTLHGAGVMAAPPSGITAPRHSMAGIGSRAEAIAQLNAVAAYFERTEPSSPAAYMARKAARWADMPLHAWLRDVIKNEQELANLESLLDMLGTPAADAG